MGNKGKNTKPEVTEDVFVCRKEMSGETKFSRSVGDDVKLRKGS